MASAVHPGQEVALADLLMLQMTGRLDEFLGQLNNGTDTSRFLEAAWGTVTTPKLFEEIVNRSVEAQFGEKHVALRELVQNALDAYVSKDNRLVDITTSTGDRGFQVSVTDNGVGMSDREVLRDLLIPYNSGKELDPEKIGEHGIGWFSVLDLADRVNVYSRKASHAPVHAQVQRKGGRWVTDVDHTSMDGLASKTGTKVVLDLPPTSTVNDIADFLNLYIGYVDRSTADIRFNGLKINTLMDGYTLGGTARIVSRDLEGKLSVFLSTRHLTAHAYSNDGYRLRDVNIARMLYTQNGLFVKFNLEPFNAESIHFSFFRQLAMNGIDFWVDLPPNIRLTKGRNNVIADDEPALMKAIYTAFEDTIIESVLSNDAIMDKCRYPIEAVLAQLFEKRYSKLLEQFERRTYSRTRRFYSKAAYVGMEMARMASGLAHAAATGITFLPIAARHLSGVPHYVGNAVRGAGTGMAAIPEVLSESIPGILRGLGSAGKAASASGSYIKSHWWTMAKIGTSAGTTAFLGYEAYANRHFLSFVGVRLLAFVLLGGGATLAAKYHSEIRQFTADAVMGIANSLKSHNPDYHSWSETPTSLFRGICQGLGKAKTSIEDFVTEAFSMAKITKKREDMVRRRTESVGKRYLSRLHVDGFTKRITSKNIVSGRFARVKLQTGSDYIEYNSRSSYAFNPSRISVDELVRLFALNKVKEHSSLLVKEGDFIIDQSSHLSRVLFDQLSAIRKHVQQDYSPRVIEDYLRDIKTFFGETLSTIYDIFHPSTWGKYHSELGKADATGYNPSIIAHSGISIRWMVNHALGAAGGIAGLAGKVACTTANPATYVTAGRVAGRAAYATWRGASGAFKTVTTRKKRETAPPQPDKPKIRPRNETQPKEPFHVRELAMATLKTAAFVIAVPCYVMKELLTPSNYSKVYHSAQSIKVPFIAAHAPAVWKNFSSFWGAGADFFIVGYDQSIKPMSGNRISSIVERTGLGGEYLSVYRTVSRIEELLSEASGLPARKVQMHTSEIGSYMVLYPPKYDDGVLINLHGENTNGLVNAARQGRLTMDFVMLNVFNHLVHEKAHQKVGIAEHNSEGLHNLNFDRVVELRKKGHAAWPDYSTELYNAKEGILNKLAGLLESRGATMESELSPFYQQDSEKPQSIPLEGLVALSRMNQRQLNRVRANLGRGRAYFYDYMTQAFYATPEPKQQPNRAKSS